MQTQGNLRWRRCRSLRCAGRSVQYVCVAISCPLYSQRDGSNIKKSDMLPGQPDNPPLHKAVPQTGL